MPNGGTPGRAGAVALVAAFLVVHVGLALVNVLATAYNPAGDVTGVYRFWIDHWRQTGVLVGVDTAWVYPIGALPPMLAASVLGDGAYLWTWLGIVTVLDAAALWLLARRRRSLAWWWLGSTALLGPVALSRIDAIALPIAIAGVLLVATRPWLASLLFTLAAWVKVWPAALVAAMLLALKRVSGAVTAAALASAGIIGLTVLAGGGGAVFSFLTAQADRGLQVEAPVAIPWLWSAALGDPGVQVYYDTTILTYQLRGAGVAAVAGAMNPVLLVGVAAVVALALVARARGAAPLPLVAVTGLALVSAVIALNKVGSPQYLTWYVAPILLGLLVDARRFRGVSIAVLVAAGLTQLVYPWWYAGVVVPEPAAIAVLTLRNAIEVGLLGWALVALASLRAPAEPGADARPASPSVAAR
ncbi:glycosyltransferase 87 family protein [Amnibacterium endophyticum]|uniref:Glycosyltransferase 87 family protein n=1 Tax=Amnibacterium endophyticum TaxID=2109337 RepID=A0ABW4LFN4_9MICO